MSHMHKRALRVEGPFAFARMRIFRERRAVVILPGCSLPRCSGLRSCRRSRLQPGPRAGITLSRVASARGRPRWPARSTSSRSMRSPARDTWCAQRRGWIRIGVRSALRQRGPLGISRAGISGTPRGCRPVARGQGQARAGRSPPSRGRMGEHRCAGQWTRWPIRRREPRRRAVVSSPTFPTRRRSGERGVRSLDATPH
jgi:hypothetical protein